MRRYWLVLAILFAIDLGMEIGGYRYGHGDPGQLTFAISMLLMSLSFLVYHRWLRLVLALSAGVGSVIFLSLLTRGAWHTGI